MANMDVFNTDSTVTELAVDKHTCEHMDIWSPSDKYGPYITAVKFLSSDRLIVGDFRNDCVKLFDSTHKLKDTLPLPGGDHIQPLAMALVSDNELVVNCHWRRKLQFVNVVGDSLKIGKTLEHQGNYKYHGLAYFDDQLIVTDNGRDAIKILDMTGKIRKRIKTGNSYPRDIVVNPHYGIMYVTNVRDNSVMCMDMNGTVLCVYKHDHLQETHGMFMNADGSLYVCGWGSQNIHHITAQCTHIRTLLDRGEIRRPITVACNPSGNTMYVAESQNYNSIKIFKLD